MSKIIGIDLGTTNSVVAVMEQGEAKIIPNSEGQRTTPSVVAYAKDNEVLVGATARRQAVTNPTNTVYSSKRFIGNNYNEASEEIKHVPYEVVGGSQGEAVFMLNGKKYNPQEIAAKVLGKLKSAAEDYLGSTVSEAVITVPAYFNDSQRQATKDAGRIAGLDVKRIVAEPTAAALAYGLDKKKNEKIAVFDFGGGTFDISILEVGDSVVEVLATKGDTHLGGDNIDEKLIGYFCKTFKNDTGIDIVNDPMAMQRLKETAEKAKIELSSAQTTEINLPFLTADQSGPKHMNINLTRAKFEQLVGDIISKTIVPCRDVLKAAGVTVDDINEVVLVGGSTRIPLVQNKVKEFFQREPNRSVNPDEVVAVGAAVQAGILGGDIKDVLLLDVTPISYGIETLGGVFTRLIEGNTTIPTKKAQIFSTAADNQPSVEIVVLQGERQMAADNKQIGRFNLTEVPPAPRGLPQIEVSFDIDANGIINVSAKDLGTGREQKIVIESSTRLSDEEIVRMKKDAEMHAEADRQKKEQVESRNELDSLVFQAEKLLRENGEKISTETKSELESEISAAKSKLSSEDVETLKGAKTALEKKIHQLSEQIYKQATDNSASSTPTGDTAEGTTSDDQPPQGDVVDAEFEEGSPQQ